MVRTIVRHGPSRAASLFISAAIALSTVAAAAGGVAAVDYNNTNPLTTPCGDGSHEVFPIRSFYINGAGSGLIYARLELRLSLYCNTAWTKVVNLTGSGTGYATERSLTSEEQIVTYSCPNTTLCFNSSQRETGDVLPGRGDAAWSRQLTIPPPGSRGTPSAKQPPTLRGLATVRFDSYTINFDTALEPLWTWYANNFRNERELRNNARVMTCTNDPDRCVTHGTPNFASATVRYEIHSNVDALASVDVDGDIRNVLLPAWSQRTTRSPKLVTCASPCDEDVLAIAVPEEDFDLAGRLAVTVRHGYTAPTPAEFLKQTIKLNNTLDYDHSCGVADDGCYAPPGIDDRPLISHEIGHSIGVHHCDMNYQVMCSARPSPNDEIDEGTMYWKPQALDVRALLAFYP